MAICGTVSRRVFCSKKPAKKEVGKESFSSYRSDARPRVSKTDALLNRIGAGASSRLKPEVNRAALSSAELSACLDKARS